ncbi:MAG: S1C family serine protease [Acidimicrobiales bacterium]
MRWSRAAGVTLALVCVAALAASLFGVEAPPPTRAPRPARHTPAAPSASQIASAIVPDLAEVRANVGAATLDGTGIVVSPNGVVLTDNHVIDGASDIRVTDLADGRTYHATALGYDVDADVAVLALSGATGLPSAPVADFAGAHVGAVVVALAAEPDRRPTHVAAGGRVVASGTSIVSRSQITGASRPLAGLLESSAAAGPGFSGGPLVDSGGRVVGMTVAYATTGAATRSYAVPSDEVRSIANDVVQHRAQLGVHVGPTAGLGVEISPVRSIGAVVVHVPAGSPLASAGLGAGDVIDTVTGAPVTSPTSLGEALLAHRPGQQVWVQWLTPKDVVRRAEDTLAPGPPA